ncbi:4-hydroxybenzoyl-CoA thioesterase [Solidesulfovibrio carbinoliphilus subsp. oakridgensis]|jgi:acyl-CoA thioester hydrolase|uniref:4-hydroxybenzoyl-CoA thioesterase n=1 Tax=Solidesulfovibrio carbinoliphilus subsp. oakridgensis TaxID=694327 RepID=G7Q625_9BACT|nr:thioesterase family protein [Solidesulfovibrio carbinoliphilus]EHJ47041.1 4-hydroxybenzoyl-CoA thioesterase [Solidesulfovibrio carbinoliphilus subsp. oakridgensis]
MALILKPEGFPRPDTRLRLTVSYGETDRMGYAYYGHYPHWFEQARGRFIRERGMSYAAVEARGVWLPVRDMAVRYLRPAHYDEDIVVRAGVAAWGRASVTFVYQVFGPPDDGVLLAAGETLHACTSPEGRPIAVPDWLRSLFSV